MVFLPTPQLKRKIGCSHLLSRCAHRPWRLFLNREPSRVRKKNDYSQGWGPHSNCARRFLPMKGPACLPRAPLTWCTPECVLWAPVLDSWGVHPNTCLIQIQGGCRAGDFVVFTNFLMLAQWWPRGQEAARDTLDIIRHPGRRMAFWEWNISTNA